MACFRSMTFHNLSYVTFLFNRSVNGSQPDRTSRQSRGTIPGAGKTQRIASDRQLNPAPDAIERSHADNLERAMAESLCCSWSKQLLAAGRKRPARDTVRAATSHAVRVLRRETRSEGYGRRTGAAIEPVGGVGARQARDSEPSQVSAVGFSSWLWNRATVAARVNRSLHRRGKPFLPGSGPWTVQGHGLTSLAFIVR